MWPATCRDRARIGEGWLRNESTLDVESETKQSDLLNIVKD
jgi:hypothetical protein